MTSGPQVRTRSKSTSSSMCSAAFVAKPLHPREPSSVVTASDSAEARNRFSIMSFDDDFAPMTAAAFEPKRGAMSSTGASEAAPLPPATSR